jgi:hypothetical protein
MNPWISQLLDEGLVPYISTSEHYLQYLDLSLFGGKEIIRVLENPEHRNFHEAYLVSNSLAFGNPNLKMQNWVYIDCVLMQSAVVGFAIPIDKAPATLVNHYEKDPWVDADKLDYIPISGQIASMGIDRRTLVGFSLFSLRRQIEHINVHKLAHKTKYAALKVYRAEELDKYVGISQYDNKGLLTHTLFGKKMFIDQTTAPLHPLRDMSFTYSMKVDLDERRILDEMSQEVGGYDFLLKADDFKKKMEMQDRIKSGERFYIQDPVHIRKDDGLYLPIKIER